MDIRFFKDYSAYGRVPAISNPQAATLPLSPDRRRTWELGGFLFMCAILLFLEIRQPYYFAQDDNFACALPVHLLGCRAAFVGQFPTYNSFQFMGAPTNTTGCYMLFYPCLYLAYAIARWVFQNANATEDVFCIGHIIAGYLSCAFLCRTIGIRPSISTLAACSFALSGFALIGGRSWDNTTPLLVYLPLLFALLIQLMRRRPDWRWTIAASCLIALSLNSGFVQLWLYAILFGAAFLVAAVASRQATIQRCGWVMPPLCIGIAFGMPLLLSFRQSTEGWTRSVGEGPRIVWSNALNMFLPAPLAPPIWNGPQAFRWGSLHHELMGELYNSGSLLTSIGILSTLAAITSLIVQRKRIEFWPNIWGLMGVLAFVCGLGSQSILWPLMRMLPLMRQMESPFKFAAFFSLFWILQGATVLERRLSASMATRGHDTALAIAGFGLLCWHAALCLPAFYTYGDRPYPSLPALEQAELTGQPARVFPIAPYRSTAPGFTASLGNDWATVYSAYAVFGYDPPVETLPSTVILRRRFQCAPLAALQACGVRWVLVHRTAIQPVYSPNPLVRDLETVNPADLPVYSAVCYRRRPVMVTSDMLIFKVPSPDPLAFSVSGTSKRLLPIASGATGIDVDVRSISSPDVVVNFAMRHGLIGEIDGKRVPLNADEWGRITVHVPPGSRTLRIRYTLPWDGCLIAGLALIAAGYVVARWLMASERRSFARQPLRSPG